VQAAKLKELESALAEFISLSDRAKERFGVGFEKVPVYEIQDGNVGQVSKVAKKNRRSSTLAKKNT